MKGPSLFVCIQRRYCISLDYYQSKLCMPFPSCLWILNSFQGYRQLYLPGWVSLINDFIAFPWDVVVKRMHICCGQFLLEICILVATTGGKSYYNMTSARSDWTFYLIVASVGFIASPVFHLIVEWNCIKRYPLSCIFRWIVLSFLCDPTHNPIDKAIVRSSIQIYWLLLWRGS